MLGDVNKKICFRKFVDNALLPQANFPTHNLNFHWRRRWWDWIQAIFLNFFYFTHQSCNVKICWLTHKVQKTSQQTCSWNQTSNPETTNPKCFSWKWVCYPIFKELQIGLFWQKWTLLLGFFFGFFDSQTKIQS